MRRIALVLTLAVAPLLAQSAPYHVTHNYPLGGNGSWDYIIPDPPSHRVFIGRQDRVMVVDETTGTLLGEVAGVKGAHGIAVDSAAGRGFATSGTDESVVVFDLKTLKVLDRIHTAEDTDAVIYDAPSNRVITSNGDAHSLTAIDPQAGKVVAQIPVGGKAEYLVSSGDGKVYVNLTDTAEVVEVEAKAGTVSRRWSTAPCKLPVSMAIDTRNHRLFSGCRSNMMAVSDYQAGKVVATTPIGAGNDGIAFDPESGDLFATNADGTLTVIHQDTPDKYHVVQTMQTAPASRNVGLDPTNHRVFVAAAKFGAPVAGGTGRGAMVPGSFTLMVIERDQAAR
jgi:DNA-binding beta-propeller fold protein YncE